MELDIDDEIEYIKEHKMNMNWNEINIDEMSADKLNNNKLTINNIDKLKGKSIGLYKIDDIIATDESYLIKGVKPDELTKDDELLLTTIYRDVKYDGDGGEVCHHRMLRAVSRASRRSSSVFRRFSPMPKTVLPHRNQFFEAKEFERPLSHMNEMRAWLNWMGAYANEDGWKVENM